MSKKLVKDRSLYTIKKVHSKTNNGTIYENDYLTIVRNDGIFDEIPMFSESNFKFKINTSDRNQKRHIKLDWLLTDSGESAWTKDNLSGIVCEEAKKDVFSPNYSSLKDFAYYGSAVELIKATINDIILRFPGGLYYYGENAPKVTIDGDTEYYLVSNECQIDCWSQNVTSIEEGENPLRYLSYSYNDYVDSSGKSIGEPKINISGNCLNSIIGEVKINEKNTLKIYHDNNGHNHLVVKDIKNAGLIIKPKKEIIDKFWATLDSFERALLNRDTNPIYTAVFDTPYRSESGYFYTPQKYTWPTIEADKDFMPDLTTFNFQAYLESLLKLAEFHDEYDSDNIWRMMTHESIKNLDWTHTSNNETFEDIDNSRMKALIQIQGRQFDELKQYIDNIKYKNTISYSSVNAVPNNFLLNIVESDGWVSKNISPAISLDGTNYTEDKLYNEFLKRLSLCSNYIQSLKGTKRGVETLLGLFGFNTTGETKDVEITEYYATVKRPLSYSEGSCLRTEFEYVNADENIDFMIGYPVMQFLEEVKGKDEIMLYPWYDPNEKYIGNFYYQCNGGWCKTNELKINNSDITKISTITSDFIYKETEPYILYLKDTNELISLPNNKLKREMICYVEDISGMDYKKGENDMSNDYSHYFKLINMSLSTRLGFVNEGNFNCYGWYNIKESEFNGEGEATDDGKKVLYLESIKQNSTGNNPHTGKGDYDFGLDYLLKYKQLFREAISEGKCDNIEPQKRENIEKFGFEFDGIQSAESKCFISLLKNGEDFYGIGDAEEIETLKRINIKNITIRFTTNEYKEFILEYVLPYLEMMIPSTAIVEILFGEEASYIDTMNSKLTGDTVTYNIEPADVIMSETAPWFEDDTWQK